MLLFALNAPRRPSVPVRLTVTRSLLTVTSRARCASRIRFPPPLSKRPFALPVNFDIGLCVQLVSNRRQRKLFPICVSKLFIQQACSVEPWAKFVEHCD
ncbi:hypothetical protein T08_15092 [Trichinella sp. T8]|nr:hypothetical protein T08_15092 [Trichinella sp. T8]